ncbi:MAG: aminotransferase class I/II-fold pyridoxal phosphate-dependent enzyme [Verrucomicrobia bacterium]|nr:aminotransferase class I/II-fold pyridoxal phosphate-dependent enzyme [Verrucomicrobiota bacterium]
MYVQSKQKEQTFGDGRPGGPAEPVFHEANRLKRLPPYLFTIIDDLKRKVRNRGADLIDLGMGNPDLLTPRHVAEALIRATQEDAEYHRYSKRDGDLERRFRRAIADWYFDRFSVTLDPDTEVLPLIGSKEGIAHLSLAFLNNDDIALVPSPAYPVHFNGVIMAGGILYNLPLKPENNYLPDLEGLDSHVVSRSKMMFMSYPHNPTTAVADLDFYERAARWARKHNILIGSDNAYSDIVYDGFRAPSFLQTKCGRDVGIEFHTLSKSYSMAGWRIGFVVGNAGILAALEKTKSYIDFGIFRAVQHAAIAALSGPQDGVKELVDTYRRRLEVFIPGLAEAGWIVPMPKATFYVWAHIPLKYSALSSLEFSRLMIEEIGVASAPGTGFGEYGEGFVRFAMVESEDRLAEAVRRIRTFLNIKI